MNAIEKRQFERYPVHLKATLSLAGKTYRVIIMKISAGGAYIAPHKAGTVIGDVVSQSVTLNISGFGGFEGTIVRSEGEFFGIQFNEMHKMIVYLILESVAV